VPIGAVLCGPKAKDLLQPGDHGSTFGGNPLALRAALETIHIMESDGLLENAASVGAWLKSEFERELRPLAGVREVRGQGLMLGIELDRPCAELATRAVAAGLLISITSDSVIRLLPPLIFTLNDAAELVRILVPLIKRFLAEGCAGT
jgi:acetylornithine/N-succinyldiaminopimelate aminotransferase